MADDPQSEIRNPKLEHVTVLLHEAVDLLAPRPRGVYLDGTMGGGGHAEEILKRSAPDGIVIGLDQDADAVARSRERLAPYGKRIVIRQANFRDIAEVLSGLGIDALTASCWTWACRGSISGTPSAVSASRRRGLWTCG